jgi:hypothetical protein
VLPLEKLPRSRTGNPLDLVYVSINLVAVVSEVFFEVEKTTITATASDIN